MFNGVYFSCWGVPSHSLETLLARSLFSLFHLHLSLSLFSKLILLMQYSSVDEAVETRNAVYNLQWPPNGGRLLVSDYVSPQEVQMRVEADDKKTPAAPAHAGPTVGAAIPIPPHQTQPQPQPQPSPRNQFPRQGPPLPPSLPPPPPVLRELPLPPPPPLVEKQEPPIVTLDDLFKKTKATPRIYYLPLSEEQVAAKQASLGQHTKP